MGIRFVKIATNGLLFDSIKIKELHDSGLDYLSFSVDGATEESYLKFRRRGNFQELLANIKKVVVQKHENLKVEMQFIIMSHNENEIDSIKNIAEGLGVDILRLKKVLIKNAEWENLSPKQCKYCRYSNMRKMESCNRPKKELVICSNGTVIPCCYIVGKDIEEYALGNIFKQNLSDIISSDKYTMFVNNSLNDKNKNLCCVDCEEGNAEIDYDIISLNDIQKED
jgi:radical SAM protein with 4Fe4S-binding SPASM domain